MRRAIIAGSSQTYTESLHIAKNCSSVPGRTALTLPLFRWLASRETQRHASADFRAPLSVKALTRPARAAPLLQMGQVRFTIVGDGPERANLERLTRSLRIEEVVSFCGWIDHSEVIQRLAVADVLVFPSVRDFGGGWSSRAWLWVPSR